MVGLLLTIAAGWASDDEVSCALAGELMTAEMRVLELDFAGANRAVDAIAEQFVCGRNEPEDLARYWLLVGALASFEGDAERTNDALVAARAADPELWLPVLGNALKAQWEKAFPEPGDATVVLEPLPEGYEVRIDGRVTTERLVVRPGLHVVQANGGGVGWGRVFRASANEAVTLPTGLSALVADAPVPVGPIEIPPEIVEPSDAPSFSLHVGLGFGGALGQELSSASLAEPGAKLGPTLELGGVLRPGAAWVRVAVGADLVIGGSYVYFERDSAVAHGWPLAPVLHAAGGVTVGERLDLGVLAGAQLPGRIPLRAVASYGVMEVLRLEARAGVNLGTPAPVADDPERTALRIEPAFGLLATLAIP